MDIGFRFQADCTVIGIDTLYLLTTGGNDHAKHTQSRTNSILQRAVKKYYVVHPGAFEVDLTQNIGYSMAIDHAMSQKC